MSKSKGKSSSKKDASAPHTKIHPLIEKIRKGEHNLEDKAFLVGYFGEEEEGGHKRLYTSLHLQSYYQVKKDDIIHSLPVNPRNPNSPSLVFLKPKSKVALVMPAESFFHGTITQAFLHGAANPLALLSADAGNSAISEALGGCRGCPQ